MPFCVAVEHQQRCLQGRVADVGVLDVDRRGDVVADRVRHDHVGLEDAEAALHDREDVRERLRIAGVVGDAARNRCRA